MNDEKEYVSIPDGTEDDEPIIIIPDEEEERDYSEHTSLLSSVAAASVCLGEKQEKKKRTLGDVLRDFWYYHKNAVIIILFTAALLSVLFAALCSKRTDDLTVAVYSENYYSDSEMISLKLFFSNRIDDFNNDESNTVNADFIVSDEIEYITAQAEADHNNRVRCIYLTDREAFEHICGLFPDMFESYNGCEQWIPLSGTDLCRELLESGFDCSDLGISLLAKPEGDTEQYDRAVSLLDDLREEFPEVFE